MNTSSAPIATPWKESFGTCACCGRSSKTIWGDLSVNETTLAVYFVQWTVGAPGHDANIDLVIGKWGEGTQPNSRILVSLLYRPSKENGSFMVIDSEQRLAGKSQICGRAMRRAEVVGTPFAPEVFALLDGLWLSDPRIAEVKALNDAA